MSLCAGFGKCLILIYFLRFSLSYVELATRRIAAVAKTSKIVVEKSTVPCRTAESMRTILEANSNEPEVK